MSEQQPWQLKMFSKSLKKQQKFKGLKKHINDLQGKKCLLITCGDNNGATNHHFRNLGGDWTWADLEENNIEEMKQLLQEEVIQVDKAGQKLPFRDQEFDLLVSIDVHEHLEDPLPITKEYRRVIKEDGMVLVTTPNGNEKKLAVRLKHLVGMRVKDYGHFRVGFDVPDLEKLLRDADLTPTRSSSYAKFFTEFMELIINFAYVKVLAKKGKAEVEEGTIAPTSKEQLKSVEKSYRIYALVYPFFKAVSLLDGLIFFTRGYAVIVEAKK